MEGKQRYIGYRMGYRAGIAGQHDLGREIAMVG
jgi:hypothetical protein